jgi:hypothetical protein
MGRPVRIATGGRGSLDSQNRATSYRDALDALLQLYEDWVGNNPILLTGRLVMARILALVLGVAMSSAGGTAVACFEEHESNSYEPDYRSGYVGLVDMAGSATSDDGPRIPYATLMAAGAVVVGGSAFLIAKQTRTGR